MTDNKKNYQLDLEADIPAPVQARGHGRETATEQGAPPILTGGLPTNLEHCAELVKLLDLKENTNLDLYIQPVKFCTGLDEFSVNFDWWQGTVFIPDNELTEQDLHLAFLSMLEVDLLNIFHPSPVFSFSDKAFNNYLSANVWRDSSSKTDSTRILKCEFGGNPGYHLTTSGFHSSRVASLMQSYGAIPTRIDVALDVFFPYFGESFFDDVCNYFFQFAKDNRLVTEIAGDWNVPNNNGRTLYVGGKKSALSCVIYQKGLQMHNDSDFAAAMPHWVRIEFRFQPQSKENRIKFSKLSPFECLSSGWCSSALSGLGFDLQKARSLTPPKKYTPFERSQSVLISQYGNTLKTWLENSDSPESFLAELLQKLQKTEKIDKSFIDLFLAKKSK